MKVIEDFKDIKNPFKNAVITIGNFDGVHLGHQALFKRLIEKAKELDGTSIAMTFDPHPMKVLKKNSQPPLITLYEQKAELIENAGIDVLICIPFTKEFALISAKDFVENILVKRIGIKAIVVGDDYSFGRNREGNLGLLKYYGDIYDFEVIVIKELNVSNDCSERISSTRIRELVMEGKVKESKNLLGRFYQIRGKVVTGRNRGGKLLGFPTANINLYDELSPKTGVYAVTVEFKGRKYKGVANIGFSPTFDDHIFTVEVHVLDFNENICGETIRINFIDRLRDEKKFAGIKELSEQIKKDIDKAKEILFL